MGPKRVSSPPSTWPLSLAQPTSNGRLSPLSSPSFGVSGTGITSENTEGDSGRDALAVMKAYSLDPPVEPVIVEGELHSAIR